MRISSIRDTSSGSFNDFTLIGVERRLPVSDDIQLFVL